MKKKTKTIKLYTPKPTDKIDRIKCSMCGNKITLVSLMPSDQERKKQLKLITTYDRESLAEKEIWEQYNDLINMTNYQKSKGGGNLPPPLPKQEKWEKEFEKLIVGYGYEKTRIKWFISQLLSAQKADLKREIREMIEKAMTKRHHIECDYHITDNLNDCDCGVLCENLALQKVKEEIEKL